MFGGLEKWLYLCGVLVMCNTSTLQYHNIHRQTIMKKTILTFVFLFAAVLCCNAQIFWKITGNGLSRPSYLLGTHHVAPVEVLDSLEGFSDILAGVDKVYGEMVMSEAMSPAGQQVMAMAAMAPSDSTLSMVLAPAQMDSLTAVLRHYMGPQVSAEAFEPLKPSMVSTVLAMAQSQVAFPGFDSSRQLDGVVQERAAALGKEIGGFENINEQCAVLFGGSISSQVEDLLEVVRHDDQAVDMAKKLAQAYMSGDLNAILSILENPEFTTPEATDRLINKRNLNWMRVLSALLPTASVLIAVGAGHLPGEKGLISLLRKDGYTVEKI